MPNPDKSCSGYADGRDCAEVEREAIDLFDSIDHSRTVYLQIAFWKLFWLKQKYWPLDPEKCKEERRKYFAQQFETRAIQSITEQ